MTEKDVLIERELLSYCYNHKDEYVSFKNEKIFECLIGLIEEGEITTKQQLAEYGMEY